MMMNFSTQPQTTERYQYKKYANFKDGNTKQVILMGVNVADDLRNGLVQFHEVTTTAQDGSKRYNKIKCNATVDNFGTINDMDCPVCQGTTNKAELKELKFKKRLFLTLFDVNTGEVMVWFAPLGKQNAFFKTLTANIHAGHNTANRMVYSLSRQGQGLETTYSMIPLNQQYGGELPMNGAGEPVDMYVRTWTAEDFDARSKYIVLQSGAQPFAQSVGNTQQFAQQSPAGTGAMGFVPQQPQQFAPQPVVQQMPAPTPFNGAVGNAPHGFVQQMPTPNVNPNPNFSGVAPTPTGNTVSPFPDLPWGNK